MSIYARKYKPSKWEPIIFADKLDDMFTDFAARDFGIKDLKSMVRRKYAIAPLDEEDFDFYFAIKVENGEISYEQTVENMFKGWMGNYYKIMSRQQRKHMIELFERLFNKQVRIHKHKMIITETA